MPMPLGSITKTGVAFQYSTTGMAKWEEKSDELEDSAAEGKMGRIIDGGGERLAVRFSQKACSHKNISGATPRYRHLPSESVIEDLKNKSSVSCSMPLVMNTSFVW